MREANTIFILMVMSLVGCSALDTELEKGPEFAPGKICRILVTPSSDGEIGNLKGYLFNDGILIKGYSEMTLDENISNTAPDLTELVRIDSIKQHTENSSISSISEWVPVALTIVSCVKNKESDDNTGTQDIMSFRLHTTNYARRVDYQYHTLII